MRVAQLTTPPTKCRQTRNKRQIIFKMPRLTIKHACIADVIADENPKGRGQDKTVILNVDEEDFFDMLDHVNPKNLIKYLDMRNIAHRDAVLVSVKTIDTSNLQVDGNQLSRTVRTLERIAERSKKKINRLQTLCDTYGPSNTVVKKQK